MKRKWKIAAVVVCVFFLLTVAYAAVSGAGSKNDPLVTLSYLTNIFAPQVEELAEDAVAEQQVENREELEEAIEDWDWRVQQAIEDAGVSGGGGATYQLVELEAGEILVLGEGCEVLLRSGNAKWTAESLLMDITSGGGLANGKQLAANHMYMALDEGYITVEDNRPASTPQPTQTTGTVTDGPLNVRSGPGSGNSVVGTLNKGDTVVILSTVDGWHQITSGSISGYISADYVDVHEAEPAPSEEPEPATATFMVRGVYSVE